MTGCSTHGFERDDDMCPNCVTPWKCNGPHLTVGEPTIWHHGGAFTHGVGYPCEVCAEDQP